MAKKDIDWHNLGFGYVKTDKRYVSNFKNGAWDDGALISDDTITISECAGVLQYAILSSYLIQISIYRV